jgi:hypothetical protein
MKKILPDFLRRGLASLGFGPLILAVVYLISGRCAGVQTLTVEEVVIGIFSLSALAFVAGGMNAIYQIEQLPLMKAIALHGSVLYVSYLLTYLLNGWLQQGWMPILVFTAIFIAGYLAIWAVIYFVIKRNTEQVNAILKKKQQNIQ